MFCTGEKFVFDNIKGKYFIISSSRQVTSGVCQGSVLGPLLFNVFINDITDLLDPSTTAKLFADDIKLYSSFSNILPNCLQSQLNIIERWSSVWQMRISHSKCNILTIGHHQANNKLQIDNHNIDTVETANDLGVTIDSKLSFHPHITNIVSKANQRKSLILRCFLSRNPANLLRAFKVYVRPLLEYASHNLVTIIRHPNYRTRKRPTRLHKTNPRLQPPELRRAPLAPQTRKLRTQTVDRGPCILLQHSKG